MPQKFTHGNFSKTSIIYILFILLSFVLGCSGLKSTKSHTISIDFHDHILERVQAREKEIQNLKGIAKIKVFDESGNYSFKEIIIVERPSSLRMETLGFFGQPFFYLVAKDDHLSILSVKENRLYRGEANSKNLSLLLPFYLQSNDLFSVLLSKTPLIAYSETDARFMMEKNQYLIKLEQKETNSRQIIWVDSSDFVVLRSEAYNSMGNLVFLIQFDNYKTVNSTLFPLSTDISLPLTSTKIHIDYSELEVNTSLSHDTFHLHTPPGTEVVDLD